MSLLIRLLILALAAYLIARAFQRLFLPNPRPRPTESQSPPEDPYTILGVERGASKEEIKKAYRVALTEYHPDKVEHLGKDIQRLAKEKTEKITEAYHQLI